MIYVNPYSIQFSICCELCTQKKLKQIMSGNPKMPKTIKDFVADMIKRYPMKSTDIAEVFNALEKNCLPNGRPIKEKESKAFARVFKELLHASARKRKRAMYDTEFKSPEAVDEEATTVFALYEASEKLPEDYLITRKGQLKIMAEQIKKQMANPSETKKAKEKETSHGKRVEEYIIPMPINPTQSFDEKAIFDTITQTIQLATGAGESSGNTSLDGTLNCPQVVLTPYPRQHCLHAHKLTAFTVR